MARPVILALNNPTDHWIQQAKEGFPNPVDVVQCADQASLDQLSGRDIVKVAVAFNGPLTFSDVQRFIPDPMSVGRVGRPEDTRLWDKQLQGCR